MAGYFIIEHPRRGVLKSEPSKQTGKPSFSPTNGRADERNARYYQLRSAIADWQSLPDRVRAECDVRDSTPADHSYNGAWPVVWPLERKHPALVVPELPLPDDDADGTVVAFVTVTGPDDALFGRFQLEADDLDNDAWIGQLVREKLPKR